MLHLVENQTFVIALIAVGAAANFITIPARINNPIKKAMGLAWILLSLFAEYSLVSEGFKKINAATGAAAQQTVIQWGIILIIFTIVMVGFFIHGLYSVTGQYDTVDEA